MSPSAPSTRKPVRIGVIGGGTAGHFAALALKKQFPEREVTLVESSRIPIIGVGEATTPLMLAFLYDRLGIDVEELYRDVKPTMKLGIRFDWGPGDGWFPYAFGDSDLSESAAQDGTILNQSLTALLMAAERVPVFRNDDGTMTSLLPELKYAYHLDNAPFVAFLAKQSARAGIAHLDAEIVDVALTADGGSVEHLRTHDGRELRFDLYVDATGFVSRLLGKALRTPFRSYASSLLCDTAVVASAPHGGRIRPYTQANTMQAGWCWRIGVEHEDHLGYVHSSAALTTDQAWEEMQAKYPGVHDPRIVRFKSGRHETFWSGNVVAIGNAYGFVEPLESTAIHMVIVELAYLTGCLASAGDGEPDRAFANERIGAHWDYLRGFLALHYRFNTRFDNAFWRAAREEADHSGNEAIVAKYREEGPFESMDGAGGNRADPTFGYHGAMLLLLGQQVASRGLRARTSREAWASRVGRQRALVERALAPLEAYRHLREHPELLRAAAGPDAWPRNTRERFVVSAVSRNAPFAETEWRPKRQHGFGALIDRAR